MCRHAVRAQPGNVSRSTGKDPHSLSGQTLTAVTQQYPLGGMPSGAQACCSHWPAAAAGRRRDVQFGLATYVGDLTCDVLQHMLNCDKRLPAGPGDFVARMADLA